MVVYCICMSPSINSVYCLPTSFLPRVMKQTAYTMVNKIVMKFVTQTNSAFFRKSLIRNGCRAVPNWIFTFPNYILPIFSIVYPYFFSIKIIFLEIWWTYCDLGIINDFAYKWSESDYSSILLKRQRLKTKGWRNRQASAFHLWDAGFDSCCGLTSTLIGGTTT